MGARLSIGGQAVIEGVMMRSPHSLAVAVRRKNGEIVLRESAWHSIWERLRFLRWPFLRGGVVLIESLHNGIKALSFSANEAAKDDPALREGGDGTTPEPELSSLAITLTIAASLGLGILFFLVLPHFLTWGLGVLTGIESLKDGKSAPFHIVDGVLRMGFFVLYVAAISRMKEIYRVFQYHGAEHKAIFTYENDQPLEVAATRAFTTYHPRCGTSFLLIVVLISILVFTAILPFLPVFSERAWLNQVALVFIKMPLLGPIAGIAYEMQRLSAGRFCTNPAVRGLVWPGLALQRITTKPPTDDQVEVALVAVRKVLWREAQRRSSATAVAAEPVEERVERFADFAAFVAALEGPPPAPDGTDRPDPVVSLPPSSATA